MGTLGLQPSCVHLLHPHPPSHHRPRPCILPSFPHLLSHSPFCPVDLQLSGRGSPFPASSSRTIRCLGSGGNQEHGCVGADLCAHTQLDDVPCRAETTQRPQGSPAAFCFTDGLCLLGHHGLLSDTCRKEGRGRHDRLCPPPPSWTPGHRDPTGPSPTDFK